MILDGAKLLKLPVPEIHKEPLGTSGVKTRFFERPEGRKLWYGLSKGDTLIVTKLDRLGRNARDIRNTIDHFSDRGVRLVVLNVFGGQGFPLDGPVGQIIVAVLAAVAEMEANNISERTSNGLRWLKAQGFRMGYVDWGKKPVDSGLKRTNGRPRYKLEWDTEYLDHVAEFVHSLRMGADLTKLIEEARESGYCYRGKPFMACYSLRDGRLLPAGMRQSRTHVFRQVRRFLSFLHKGELPAKYCVPGTVNPVDSGLSDQKWMNNADNGFKQRYKPRVKRIKQDVDAEIDRSSWTAEMWSEWWQTLQTGNPEDDVESLLVQIKADYRRLGLDKTPVCDHKWVKGTCVRCWEEK
jgi:hypothetical protein